VSGDPGIVSAYLEDASGYHGRAEAVFLPESEEELAGILSRASREAIPVTAAGAGTGVTGGRCAHGGWVISLERFRKLQISDGRALAGAGVLLRELQQSARASGLFYPPDPTENAAAIGGTIATNASGSRSFRFGDTRRRVLSLRVALLNGTLLDLRRGEPAPFPIQAIPLPATTKHAAGYRLEPGMDYLDLFIGSEGTLGIVYEAGLELLPAPRHFLAGVIFFGDDGVALRAVEAWLGVARMNMLEYLDSGSLDLLRARHTEIPGEARAALLIEQEMEEENSDEIGQWSLRLEDAPALEQSWFALSAADRERFRRFRHALPESVNGIVRRNGFLKLGSDYAVPVARNAEMLNCYRNTLDAEFRGRYVIFGHIGDAHVHVNILPSSEREFERGRELMVELARAAVALGGTVGAEHGLGKCKAHLLELQYAPEHIEAMRQVKRRLDPQWLLGRDTLFPYTES
jgi:FAD/FMN-containing dehydrogenase